MPFAVPFKERAARYNAVREELKQQLQVLNAAPAYHVTVRRDQIFQTGMRSLNHLGPNLKRRVSVASWGVWGVLGAVAHSHGPSRSTSSL